MDKKFLTLAAASLLASSVALADTTLDDFSTPQGPVSDETAGDGSETSPALTLSNGASRTISADLVTSAGASGRTSSVIATGVYGLSNDTGSFGNGSITWTGLGGIDLTFQQTLQVQVDRVDETAAGTPVVVTVTSGGSDVSATQPATGVGTLSFDFSAADLSSVTGLNIEVQGEVDNGVDMEISLVAAIGPGRCTITGLGDIPANDPNCRVQQCALDDSLDADDPLCVECAFVSGILASDPACVPPVTVPGISTYSLIAMLAGLPLVAGFFAARRRRK